MRKDLQNIIGPVTFEDNFKEYFTGLRGYVEEKLNKSMNHTKKNIAGFESKVTDNSILKIVTGEKASFGINTINNRNSITDFRKNWGVRYKVKLEDTNNIKKSIKRAFHGLTDEEYMSNYIDNNVARAVKKANVNNIDLSTKDTSKIKQFFTAKAKELYLGKMSNKQISKYNKVVESLQNNKNIQKILNLDVQNKGISFIDDLVKKPFSKAFNISKNVIGADITQKLAKNFSRSFSWLGYGMNAYTIGTDKSEFKVAMSGLDLLGDGIGAAITAATGGVGAPIGGLISGITSGISFVGSTGYDFFFKNTLIGKVLDKGAGYIVNPIKKVVKGIKEMLFTDMTNYSVDFTSQSVKGRTRGIGIKSKNKSTQKLIRGIKMKQSRPYSNVIDMYHNNSNSMKNNNLKMHHDRGRPDNKLQDSQIDNSSKTTFTININGTNKSTQEIMNEIVPEIKLRMKNISIA